MEEINVSVKVDLCKWSACAMAILSSVVVALIVHGWFCRDGLAMQIMGATLIGLIALCATTAYVFRLIAVKEIARLALQLNAEKERQKSEKSSEAKGATGGDVSMGANVQEIPVKLHLTLSSSSAAT